MGIGLEFLQAAPEEKVMVILFFAVMFAVIGIMAFYADREARDD